MLHTGPEDSKDLAFKELQNTEKNFQSNMALFKERKSIRKEGEEMNLRELIQEGLNNKDITTKESELLKIIEILADRAVQMSDLSEILLKALSKEDPFSEETSVAMLRLINEFRMYTQLYLVIEKEMINFIQEKGYILNNIEPKVKDAKKLPVGLNGLLSKPFQRGPRYKMLLEALLVFTKDEENEKVKKIAGKVTEAMTALNHSLRFSEGELAKATGVEVSIKHEIDKCIVMLPEGWGFKKKEKEEEKTITSIPDRFDSREKFVVTDPKGKVVFNILFKSSFAKITEEKGHSLSREEYQERLKVLHSLIRQITTPIEDTKEAKARKKAHYVQLKPIKKGDIGIVSYLNALAAKDSKEDSAFFLQTFKERRKSKASCFIRKGIVKANDIQEHGIQTIDVKDSNEMMHVIKRGHVPYSDERINLNNTKIRIKDTIHPLIAIAQYQGTLNAGFKPLLEERTLTEVNRYLKKSLKTNTGDKQVSITSEGTTAKEGQFVLKKIKKATRDGFAVALMPDAKEALRAYLGTLSSSEEACYRLKRDIGPHGIKNLLELGLIPKIKKKPSWWSEVLQLFGFRKETLLDKLVDKLKMTEEEIQKITINSGNEDLDNHVNKLLGKPVTEEKKAEPQKQPERPDLNENTVLILGQGHLAAKTSPSLNTAVQNKTDPTSKHKL